MIVRPQSDGSLILITQNDHAKLSGMMAAHWGNARFARPWPYESSVRGAVFHDCGWYRYDTGPLYNTEQQTTPTFFQVPLDDVQLKAFQSGIDWLSDIDPYAGLLIGRHRTGLWRSRYGTIAHPVQGTPRAASEGIEAFLLHNEPKQDAAIAAFGKQQFETNYSLLQIWDLLSLYFCTAEPKQESFDPVPMGYSDSGATTRLELTPLDERRIAIDPYPFDIDPLPVEYIYRHMPTGRFPDQESFRIAYFGTSFKIRQFEFVRKS
jgi:hypothetical protein